MQFNPVTVQNILQNLPEIQKRRRRAEQLRKDQDVFGALQEKPGGGNYQPRQQGGLFPTVQQYRKDYEKFGNQLVGALGGAYSNHQANKAEDHLNEMINPEIINSVQSMGQAGNSGTPADPTAMSEGNPATEQTLRAYMSMIGGPDTKNALGRDAYVSSTQKLKNGNLGLVMSNGEIRDTKTPYDPKMAITNIPGQPYGVTSMQGGQGQFSPVTGFGGQGQMPPQDPMQQGGAPGSFGNPVPDEDKHVQDALRVANGLLEQGVPAETIDSLLQQYLNPQGGGGVPPQGAPPQGQPPMQQPPMQQPPQNPGGIAMVPTKAQEAGESEAAKIAAQNAAAIPTAQAEATKQEYVLDAKAMADARAAIPKMESVVNETSTVIGQMLNHPGLETIVGGLAGRLPDNKGVKTVFNAVMAGTPAADAMALHDQIAGKVFTAAFETLKGGGQITEKEGEQASAAYARMGRAQTVEAYRQALLDFQSATERGLEKLRAAAAGKYAANPPGAPAAPARPELPPGFTWED